MLLAGCCAMCWFLPNTQQLLMRYDPILEPVTRPGFFRLRLDWGVGLGLGFLAYLLLRNADETVASPFIYFNF